MFKGFDLTYPEYEVVTPQMKQSFMVRSLNVAEEERLKGSLVTAQKITDHLNKCLYEVIVTKPESITDYKSFMEGMTLKDRDALIYGLYHITYEEIRNYDIKCGTCFKDFSVTIKASTTFNTIPYPGDDVLNKKVKLDLPVSTGVSAYIKQPTLADEQIIIGELSARPGSTIDIVTETLVLAGFIQEKEDGKKIEYNEPVDILDAYKSLPPRDKRAIQEAYTENFGKYGIDLKMKTTCTHCGAEEVVDIDIVSQFFRALYE